MSEYKGYKQELPGNRSVAVSIGAERKDFYVEFQKPVPKGMTEEQALINCMKAKCDVKDGQMITSLILSDEAMLVFIDMATTLIMGKL